MAAGASLILHVVLIVFSLCLRLQSLLSFRLGLIQINELVVDIVFRLPRRNLRWEAIP